MKAAVNRTPNLSILHGWWIEGYADDNGWALGDETIVGDPTPQDAEALYRLLEEPVIPLYYARSDEEVPHPFVQVIKASIKSVAPAFGTRRMVKEYVDRFYTRSLGIRASQS
jgi:starch phosphorylase